MADRKFITERLFGNTDEWCCKSPDLKRQGESGHFLDRFSTKTLEPGQLWNKYRDPGDTAAVAGTQQQEIPKQTDPVAKMEELLWEPYTMEEIEADRKKGTRSMHAT